MKTIDEVNIGEYDHTKETFRAKERLEEFIDRCLLTDRERKESDVIQFSLDSDLSFYKSNDPNIRLRYDYDKDVLEPVVQQYKDAGWFVYCRKFVSFIYRHEMYFCKNPKKYCIGYNINWSDKKNPVPIKNNSDFYIPSFETIDMANTWIEKYKKELQ